MAEIAALLRGSPEGFGPTIKDRKEWNYLAQAPGFAEVVGRAEALLHSPIPELTDELFLEFSRNGNRTRAEAVIRQRRQRLCLLVLAECMENQGRFVPAIEQIISEICNQRTWLYPAHDRELRDFHGEQITIDLFSSRCAWNFATTAYWLGDRLSVETRDLVNQEIERRSLSPFEASVKTGEPRMWWLTGENNWNAVCLAGTVGSVLAAEPSRERRAFFIAAAEESRQAFLNSFTPDGYCTEGVGYWGYGYGHYVLLAELVKHATRGQIDWLEEPVAQLAARFPSRIRLTATCYPAFSDCALRPKPSPITLAFLRERGMSPIRVPPREATAAAAKKAEWLLPALGVLAGATPDDPQATLNEPARLRDWFPEHVVLVSRPARQKANRSLAVAIKGGHNAERHNHNDVGAYVVALGNQTPLVDPGREVYTARTFSPRRYESRLINSFGHPVPRPAGKLQRNGAVARAKTIRHEFTDQQDLLEIDLKSAYAAPSLSKLERRFVYSRVGRGSLEIRDSFEFDSRQEFETALMTSGRWRQSGPLELALGEGASAVSISISRNPVDAQIQITPTEITEDNGDEPTPTRIGIRFVEPLTAGSISVVVKPL